MKLPQHLHPPLTQVCLDLAGILLGPQKSEGNCTFWGQGSEEHRS